MSRKEAKTEHKTVQKRAEEELKPALNQGINLREAGITLREAGITLREAGITPGYSTTGYTPPGYSPTGYTPPV